MAATQTLAEQVGVQPACAALGVARATYYRRRQPAPVRQTPRRPPLKLSPEEAEEVLEVLHSPRFVDRSPRQIWATLLDEEGRYLCSPRTMYRLLEDHGELRERRDQLRHPKYEKPELLATRPNEVWSWDITKLRGPAKGVWYYLYLVLDIFSRCVVGWLVAERELASLAKELVEASLEKQGIPRGQLTIHADRGSSMTSKTLALLFSELGVCPSHSRPQTSNDNPFSESLFKTVKYHASYPEQFGSPQDARAFFGRLLRWYNTEHRHSSLALLTPADVHYGRAESLLEQRAQVLARAFERMPNRFKHRLPTAGTLSDRVWINPPEDSPEPFLPSPETPGPEQLSGPEQTPGIMRVAGGEAGEQAAQLCPAQSAGGFG